jgi:hypothetical protein
MSWHYVWRAEMNRRLLRQAAIVRSPEAQRLDRSMCRRSFWHWICNYGWLYAPKESESIRRWTPFVPWPSQRELMYFLLERRELEEVGLVPKARELGVTWLVLHYLFWCHRFEPGFSALVGSRNELKVDRRGDSDALFQRLRAIESRQPTWLRPLGAYVDKHMILQDVELGTEIVGESSNAGFGQGGRRTIGFIDEVGKIEAGVWESASSSVESVNGTLWLVFNPPDSSGHPIWQALDKTPESRVHRMTWRANPNRIQDETHPDYFPRTRVYPRGDLTPERFKQQHEAQIPAVEIGRIWDVPVEPLLYDDDEPGIDELRRKAPLFGGMDFGSSIVSPCVCILGLLEKSVPWRLWIEHDPFWLQEAWMKIGPEIMGLMSLYPDRGVVFYDPAGRARESSGKSWVGNLSAAGVPFGDLQKHLGTDDIYNMSTSEWGTWANQWTREWMKNGQIRIHRRCAKLRQAILEYRAKIPAGVLPIDAGNAKPVKDAASHHADALKYLVTGVWRSIEAERQLGMQAPAGVVQAESYLDVFRDGYGSPWG